MEMINGSSEEAQDKATRADRTEKTQFIPACVLCLLFTKSLQTVREKRWDNVHSLCFAFIPALQWYWQHASARKRICHTTLSLSTKGRLFVMQQFFVKTAWILCDTSCCCFPRVCYLLLLMQNKLDLALASLLCDGSFGKGKSMSQAKCFWYNQVHFVTINKGECRLHDVMIVVLFI